MGSSSLLGGVGNYLTTVGGHSLEASLDPTWFFNKNHLQEVAQDATNLDPGDILNNTIGPQLTGDYKQVANAVIPGVLNAFWPGAGAAFSLASNFGNSGNPLQNTNFMTGNGVNSLAAATPTQNDSAGASSFAGLGALSNDPGMSSSPASNPTLAPSPNLSLFDILPYLNTNPASGANNLNQNIENSGTYTNNY